MAKYFLSRIAFSVAAQFLKGFLILYPFSLNRCQTGFWLWAPLKKAFHNLCRLFQYPILCPLLLALILHAETIPGCISIFCDCMGLYMFYHKISFADPCHLAGMGTNELSNPSYRSFVKSIDSPAIVKIGSTNQNWKGMCWNKGRPLLTSVPV